MTEDELQFLRDKCPYLGEEYFRFISEFRLRPREQVEVELQLLENSEDEREPSGRIELCIKGRWVDTIFYEIPILALASETYFKYCDTDWDYTGQTENAFRKGCTLLKEACTFSEFGTRRRRDYHTQELVLSGLCKAKQYSNQQNWLGKLSGTSNVHFAMRYNLAPVGTVAHEWYMGIAAITDDYKNANEIALKQWVSVFGTGVGKDYQPLD